MFEKKDKGGDSLGRDLDGEEKRRWNHPDGTPDMPAAGDTVSMKSSQDLLALQDTDPALNMKMHLVNNAIDEIGWTNYHLKLFFLNGFGYAVDSFLLLTQSIIYQSAYTEFGEKGYKNALNVANYVGLLVGALFWGSTADMIGRKWAFNLSLLICTVATIVAGAMPNWASLGFFIALNGFGGGGNLVMDTTVFLEYLPGKKQWLLTFLAAWWGVGQAIVGFIAWGFMVPEKWNCTSVDTCTRSNNMGWRYVMFTSGAIVFVMSIARLTIIRLKETPKYLLAAGQDQRVAETLHYIANKYNRPCSLTAEALEACGPVVGAGNSSRYNFKEMFLHVKGLFATKKMTWSTLLIWLSWLLIGLAYPLFYIFINTYLATHGAAIETTTYEQWRNYALTNISGIPGPIFAAFLCEIPYLGRRYTMVIGALMSCAFFFSMTAVRTQAQSVGLTCASAFATNVYYATLYAYTPEVLPSAHRATGNGVAVAINRVMGVLSAVIETVADTSTPAPIYLCAALFIAMAVVSAIMPFESYGKRAS